MIDNLKEFSSMMALAALLFVSLLYFAVEFTADNNSDALQSSDSKFQTFKSNVTSNLISTESEGNVLLNISAESDPEASELGSSDSVATAYGMAENSGNFFDNLRLFFVWVFPGTAGYIVITVIAGLFAFSLVYFITKWIRVGY